MDVDAMKTGERRSQWPNWERARWLLRQLLPLTYRTRYVEGGRRHFVVWRMWFGRCFDVDDVVVR